MSDYQGPERRRRRWPSLRDLALVGALCLAGWSNLGLRHESDQRRDQNCRVFEGQHLTDVNRLKSTYHYLETLPRSEYGKPLTLAVLRGLSAQEQAARFDSAPDYCDEPGVEAERNGAKPVGLPEPDPRLPKRRDFSALAVPQK